mgnify:CR=1 FL=1
MQYPIAISQIRVYRYCIDFLWQVLSSHRDLRHLVKSALEHSMVIQTPGNAIRRLNWA